MMDIGNGVYAGIVHFGKRHGFDSRRFHQDFCYRPFVVRPADNPVHSALIQFIPESAGDEGTHYREICKSIVVQCPICPHRFHRVDPARAAETGGAGLGLAIVRRIARLHGGDNVTITTLASAEEQLEAAERFKASQT